MFQSAKWIWVEKGCQPDTYGEFYDEFLWEEGEVNCLLSCDGDYTLYINGQYVSSNQYGDFEWYKSYDTIDITPYLKKGKNAFAVLVWHFGVDTQRSIKAQAGLIFEVKSKTDTLLASGENTLARYSRVYKQGRQKLVTRQLGFTFSYDATMEDDWDLTGRGCQKAVIVEKSCSFIPRPIKRLEVNKLVPGMPVEVKNNRYLLDLGQEVVGYPRLVFTSPVAQKIVVAWGEDVQGGRVRKEIEGRDFSFEYMAKEGANDFTHYMLRLGCRYLELQTEQPIEIVAVGVLPQVYAVKEKKVKLAGRLDQKIYDACVNTLRLCMMEHYVDTPWREQCLYVYDSRNQALCGYHVFDEGNAEYVRANLKLIAKDRREDGLLAICYPCGIDLTIPSFSLYYFMQVKEYLQYTGDTSLVEEVYDKLISVLSVFIKNRKDGLVLRFEGANHWNFYDWSPNLDGAGYFSQGALPDLMINLLFILALDNLKWIDEKLGKAFLYEGLIEEGKQAVRNTFFQGKDGLFAMSVDGTDYTVLGNALAVLSGVATPSESRYICEKIVEGALNDCSLSMKIFKYEALLKTDKDAYQVWVHKEIQREYGKMVEEGNTVWETIDGGSAFGNAGSLCHGWSAIPIYFYTKYDMQ